MPHALITGGAGFIGSHLTDYLLERGYQVSVIDNLSTGSRENIQQHLDNPAFRFEEADMRNADLTAALVRECDVIFHLAAAVGVQNILDDPIGTIKTNIGGTELLLDLAHQHSKKILIASTSEVYGKGVKFPFEEDDDLRLGPTSRNRWSYAVSKAVDEFLGFAYYEQEGLPVVMCRLFNTVGPRQQGAYGMVLPRFVQWALNNDPIQVYGDGEQTRSFCHVADVIPALYQLSQSEDAVGQLFNVGNHHEISIRELAERVRDRASSTSEIVLIPYDEAYQTANYEDFRRRVPGLDKIKKVVGWQPAHSLDDTIDDIIRYYQEK